MKEPDFPSHLRRTITSAKAHAPWFAGLFERAKSPIRLVDHPKPEPPPDSIQTVRESLYKIAICLERLVSATAPLTTIEPRKNSGNPTNQGIETPKIADIMGRIGLAVTPPPKPTIRILLVGFLEGQRKIIKEKIINNKECDSINFDLRFIPSHFNGSFPEAQYAIASRHIGHSINDNLKRYFSNNYYHLGTTGLNKVVDKVVKIARDNSNNR